MTDIEDPTNLTGISLIVNKKHTDNRMDLNLVEKNLIGSTGLKPIRETDPVEELKNTLKDIHTETGIPDDASSLANSRPERNIRINKLSKFVKNRNRKPILSETESSSDSGSTDSDSGSESYYSGSESYYSGQTSRTTPSRASSFRKPKNPDTMENNFYQEKKTIQPNNHFDEALKVYSGKKEVNPEIENEEELKGTLLEDIDELKSELKADDVDISRVPYVDKNSSFPEVKNVHKILRMKYDRKRCNSFGTEIILAGAQGLEYIFNGKRNFGGYTPDLTGWHNTIRPKLRRLKFETSTIVSNVMHDYNIGAVGRLLLELVPSAILYSRIRRDQHGKSNYSPDAMSEAFEDLRQFD